MSCLVCTPLPPAKQKPTTVSSPKKPSPSKNNTCFFFKIKLISPLSKQWCFLIAVVVVVVGIVVGIVVGNCKWVIFAPSGGIAGWAGARQLASEVSREWPAFVDLKITQDGACCTSVLTTKTRVWGRGRGRLGGYNLILKWCSGNFFEGFPPHKSCMIWVGVTWCHVLFRCANLSMGRFFRGVWMGFDPQPKEWFPPLPFQCWFWWGIHDYPAKFQSSFRTLETISNITWMSQEIRING